MHSVSVTAPASTAVLYRIDAEDVIAEVGGAWEHFAAANGGVGPVAGRKLWHFISGDDVRAIWMLLLRQARSRREPMAFLYRCDAPGLRRLMQMELLPEPDGSVCFRSRQVRAVEAPTLDGRWQPGTRRDTVEVCGWCARVRAGDWVPADRAIELLGLTGPEARMPRLSHGICQSCARELRALVRT